MLEQAREILRHFNNIYGKVFINKYDVIEIYNYICAYIVIFVLGMGTMLIYKYPLHEAMFEFA